MWDTQYIVQLRVSHRLVGALVGALPSNKRQSAEFGAPLALSVEEALLAVEEGIVEVLDCPGFNIAGSVHAAVSETCSSGFSAIATACQAWQTAVLEPLSLSELRRAGAHRRGG